MNRLLAAVLSLCLLALAGCEKPAAPLPKLYQIPTFSVAERSGESFTRESMQGKVWVADFFFASCPSVCVELNKNLSYVRYQTAALPDVRYLSISTNEADTPEELRKYAERVEFRADARWFFVTGKKDEIYKLSIEGFKSSLEFNASAAPAESISHGTRLFLVDRAGWVRGYYDGTGDNHAAETQRLIADVKRLAAEPYTPPPASAPAAPPTSVVLPAKPVAQSATHP